MNDNFSSFLIVSAVVAFVAAFAGGFGWGVSQRVSPGIRIGIRNTFRQALLGVKWPFSRLATGIREWHRVSVYRHRRLKWDDLPRESKDDVKFHDLSEQSRDLIKLHNLPRSEKYPLLDKFILPQLFRDTIAGTLYLIDEAGRLALDESVHVTVPRGDISTQMDRDSVSLELHIAFDDPQNQFQCPVGRDIGFASQSWRFVGNIQRRSRLDTGDQSVLVAINVFSYNGLQIYYAPR